MDFNFTHVYAESSRFQPASLSHVLSLSRANFKIRHLEPSTLFSAKNNQADGFESGLWSIERYLFQDTERKDGCYYPLTQEDTGLILRDDIFLDLSTTEKNQIMCALQDDALLCSLYHAPRKFAEALDARETLTANTLMVPKLVTTKPVLLPAFLNGGFKKNKAEILDYLGQNISPALFNPEHMSEAVWNILQQLRTTADNDIIYPAQFFAVHDVCYYDESNTSISYTPPFAPGLTNMEQELLTPEHVYLKDVWNVFYQQPYEMKHIVSLPSLEDTLLFLSDVERDMIDPSYEKDTKLVRLHEALSQQCSDFHATHYSKISPAQVMAADGFLQIEFN